jgi:Protein of unknown function, DUF547
MTIPNIKPAIVILLFIALAVNFSFPLQGETEDFDWSPWETLLKAHMITGKKNGVEANLVDYRAIREAPEFRQIGQALDHYNPDNLTGKDKMAFYINCYNYFAAAMIIHNWPVESIRDIGNFFWPVWYQTAGRINGQSVTLNQIEHEILRPMGDPRIHFSINCASLSCPNLRNEIYSSDRLEQQLEDQTRRFLIDNSKGVTIQGNRLMVSQIFEWYEEDFTNDHGILGFIRKYREIPAVISEVDYIPYNWQLNALNYNEPAK